MAKILILYSTTDGHTLKICESLKQVIEADSHHVTVQSIRNANDVALDIFDKIVIGASIRYGKHSVDVVDFIARHQEILDRKPSAFFSVNAVARKPGRDQPEGNPYVVKFLNKIAWKPNHVAVFAGKIDYPRYGFVDRTIIRLIMWITRGPTDPTAVVEFTDWTRVEAFGRQISAL